MTQTTDSTFSNQSVALPEIPDYRDVEFEPVAESFRRYTVLSTLLYWLPPLVIVSAAQFFPAIPFFPGMLVVIALAVAVSAIGVYRWLDASYRGWALRDHDIVARAGVVWRGVTVLPIARIQHVETTHGPLERAHGLARLKLYTAGGLTADLIVIGLARETADRLREFLVEQIRRRDSSTAQQPDE